MSGLLLLRIKSSFSLHPDLSQRLKVFLKRSVFILGNSRNRANDLHQKASHKISLYSRGFVQFYVFTVTFHSTKVVLLGSGLCFQQHHSYSGVHPDSTEFPRNVGHMGGRERGWREEDTLLILFFSPNCMPF